METSNDEMFKEAGWRHISIVVLQEQLRITETNKKFRQCIAIDLDEFWGTDGREPTQMRGECTICEIRTEQSQPNTNEMM